MPRLAVILLLAAPVFAEDFETRYHEAYKLEVVDGKVADAAARYLDLLNEKELPAHLRAQSEFRFAVTCALLGRPDEARARLAALAAAPDVPAALKPQIEEYRKSLAELAPGSAASKRIEELVFQLGREGGGDPGSAPAVYRDFEIMGRAAAPHLLRLLDHTDRQLKEHAFRILCRLNEPGLAARWDPAWRSTVYDFRKYFTDRPEEMSILEQRLAAMPPNDTDVILSGSTSSPWSASFLKAHAERGKNIGLVVQAVVYRQDDDAKRALLATWITEGPDEFGDLAASLLTSSPATANNPKRVDARLFPMVCQRVARSAGTGEALKALAGEQPTEALLDVLAALLEAEDLQSLDETAGVVASALAARPTDAAQTLRFASLLETWMSKGRPSVEIARACAERLPADRAARLVGKYFAIMQGEYFDLVALKRPEDVALLRVAIDATAAERRRDFFNKVLSTALNFPEKSGASREMLLAMARLLPTLVGKVEAKDLAAWMRRIAPRIAAEEALAMVVDLVRREPSLEACDVLFRSDWKAPGDGAYRRDIVVPALPRIWDLLAANVRTSLVRSGLHMLDEEGPRALDGEHRKELAAFLLPRLGEMPLPVGTSLGNDAVNGYPIVARYPDLFPLEEWLPNSPQGVWDTYPPFGGAIDQERLDRAARALIADPSKVTDTVLTFLERCVSGDVSADCAAQLYRKADEKLLDMLLAHRGLMPGDTAVLEETFDRMKDADLAVVARLGFRLAEVRPSEKLYGLAERLLASPDRPLVLQGIELARSLGRDKLVPALLAKLDSMDSEVRTKAREAIDSILELKRIKDEVAQRIRDRKLEEAGFK